MDPFPPKHELLSLFECEPSLTDANVPWEYNCLRFDTTRGADRIICEIEPGYEVLRLQWSRDGTEIVRLGLNWVCGLTVEVEGGREVLVGTLRDPAIEPFRLQMRPQVHLSWGTAMQTDSSRGRSV